MSAEIIDSNAIERFGVLIEEYKVKANVVIERTKNDDIKTIMTNHMAELENLPAFSLENLDSIKAILRSPDSLSPIISKSIKDKDQATLRDAHDAIHAALSPLWFVDRFEDY